MKNFYFNSPIVLNKGSSSQRNVNDIFKQCKSSSNILTSQFNNNISTINRQLSNIKLTNQQVLNLSRKNTTEYSVCTESAKKEKKVYHISRYELMIERSKGGNDEENKALKENVKFLLNQIKKLQKSNNNDVINKLKEENKTLKSKLNEYENKYKELINENNELKSKLKNCKLNKDEIPSEDLMLSSRLNHNNSIITFSNSNSNTANLFNNNDQNQSNTVKDFKYNTLTSTSLYRKKTSLSQSHLFNRTSQMNMPLKMNSIPNNTPIKLELSSSPLYIHKLNVKKHNVLSLHIPSMKYSTSPYIDTSSFNLAYNDSNQNNILFSNITNGFLMIMGKQCNLCFFYNMNSHLISQMPSLSHSHSKGGIISYKKENIIVLSGMTSTSCEMYNVSNNKWKDIAKMNRPHADSSFILVDESTVYSIYGFDYEMNKFIYNIEKINLEKDTKWSIIKINNALSLRGHTSFVANDRLFVIGGTINDNKDNDALIEIRIVNNTAMCSVNTPNNNNNNKGFIFTSSFNQYYDSVKGKEILYNVDTEFNVHMIDKDTLNHKIFSKPSGL